jgi:DNA-binding Lrp family transcriptional regulator
MLTALDKSILNIIQTKLPVVRRPFAAVAESVGSDEQTVLERIQWMKANGYIRRMGPFFDSARLGYIGTLVAVDVAAEQMVAVAKAINAYQGVTHNYEREGTFNLWFTLLSPDKLAQNQVLAEIAALPGIRRMNSLPAIKKLKVNVQFILK